MEKWTSPILAAVLFFGTVFGSMAHALPQGSPEDYRLKTKYECETNGIPVHSKTRFLNPHHEPTVRFTPMTGESPILTFGDKDTMLWPKKTPGSFEKTLRVMTKTNRNQYIIAQEIELGESQKTKTRLSLTVKDNPTSEPLAVNCKVEMEWVKR